MKQLPVFIAMMAVAAADAVPSVSNIELATVDGREMTVTYDLADGPAVVTLSIETNNGSAWLPMDDKVVSRAMGDVNRKITASSGAISFIPEGELPEDAASIRAVVTAWPMDDTPDYMVFSLAEGAVSAADRVRYYASTNAIPGGLLDNVEYRTCSMVFRKILAKGVTWTMGSDHDIEPSGKGYDAQETPHNVTMSRNYYLGVFPLTHGQYRTLMGSWHGRFSKGRAMRIQDELFYAINQCMRGNSYPQDPSDGSILGVMRTRSGNAIDFDLPSEAEWEYACRAGYGHNTWPTGVDMQMTYAVRLTDPDLDRLGRYKGNNASVWWSGSGDVLTLAVEQGPENGTPIAGSYAPNAWGLYDMLGGAAEMCNDWYAADITGLNGAVNVSASDPEMLADGVTAGTLRVRKGGNWHSNAFVCRPAYREGCGPKYRGDWGDSGMRVKCHMGLR